MIDLHLHTTASDGRSSPAELVHGALARGIRTMSVTDHDTRAAEAAVRSAAAPLGIVVVSGVEITTVDREKDVHVLAYGLPDETPELDAVMAAQRTSRVDRAREIAARLARAGAPIDIDTLLVSRDPGTSKAIARPDIARCLVAAGHVASVAEAFERFLGEDGPAYVPNHGVAPGAVVRLVRRAGGVASLAHPGQLKHQDLIERLLDDGLPCLEAFHSSHDAEAEARYLRLARTYGLGVTGGSDYHGPSTRRAEFFGVTVLPRECYEDFEARLAAARAGADAPWHAAYATKGSL